MHLNRMSHQLQYDRHSTEGNDGILPVEIGRILKKNDRH